jgi:hypothetical protein
MINHARTLLLNTSPRSAHAQDAGYEYIPHEFIPTTLPNALRVVYRALFGVNPDQRFLNMRSRELMAYIHQTELAEYIYKLDSRVTYWPEINSNNLLPNRQITVTQVAGSARNLAVSGNFAVAAASARARQQYLVALTTSGDGAALNNLLLVEDGAFFTAEDLAHLALESAVPGDSGANIVYLQQLGVTAPAITTPVTDFADLPVVELPNTQLKFSFSSAQGDSTTATGKWLIDVAANPAPAITTILPTLELLGEPVFLELFGVSPEEPYATFKNLWFDHPLPAYRLAGLVLAYIYRAESSRNKNNG